METAARAGKLCLIGDDIKRYKQIFWRGGGGCMEHIHGPAIYRPAHQALLCTLVTNDSTRKRGIIPNRPASDPEYDFSKSMTDIIQVLSCN